MGQYGKGFLNCYICLIHTQVNEINYTTHHVKVSGQ